MSTIQEEFEENNNTMKLSIQTHTKEALKVAERSNIRNEKMIEIYDKVKKQGYEINSELIIGMPGETSETWLDVLQTDMDNGCYFNRTYPLTVMPNTTYYSQEFREKYDANLIKIHAPKDLLDLKLTDYHKHRFIAKDYKTKNNKNNKLEWRTITMFNRCYSYSTEDLEQMYMYWWWFSTLFNTGFARKYMLNSKTRIREQAYKFFDNIDEMPLFKSFLLEHQYAFRQNFVTDTDEVWLTDLISVQYIIKNHMRLREVVDIYDNLEQATEEMRLIYPNFNTKHINENITGRSYFKMYVCDGSIEIKNADNFISKSPISIPA